MSKNRYLEDKSVNESYHSEGFVNPKNVMIGSAIAAGSLVAYKGGLLRPIIKEAIELSSEHKPMLSFAFNDMRKWLKSNEGVNEQSIFRQDIKSVAKSILKQDKDVAKAIIDGTKEDIGLYAKRLNMSLDNVASGKDNSPIINSHYNTELLNQIKRGNIEVNKYSNEYRQQRVTMKSKVYDGILSQFVRTDEELSNQLKRTGYRPATINDLFTHSEGKDGLVTLKDRTNYKFSKKMEEQYRSPVEHLQGMLNYHVSTDDGLAMFKGGKRYRMKDKYNFNNLIIDDALLVDEGGRLVDLRARRRETYESIRNLSNEWKVPFINVNPLQMMGLGKVGRPKISVGTITEDMVAPAITGEYGNTVNNTIANVKRRNEKLKDVVEGVTVINGDVYTLGKDKGIKKIDYKYKKNLTFIDKEKAGNTSALTITENSQRRMMGISSRFYEDYTKADGDKYVKQKIAKFFDIGRQEKDISKNSFENVLEGANPDGYVESIVSRLTSKVKPYRGVDEYKNFTEMMRPGRKSNQEDTIFVTNKSITLKDLKVNRFNKEMTMDYAKQYVADFKHNSELVNSKTGVAHFIVERMNQAISTVGLGTSLESNTGPVSSAVNLITKRFLPVYGAYQGWNALNAITEGEDENGQRANINRTMWEGISKFDIGVSKIRDNLGVTDFSKRIIQLMPGYDQLEELPGVKNLNLHESAEERMDYWEYGKDPIRKSRYWSLNTSTSFTGGKVSYYKMNPLQSAKADAVYSDSQFGSRKEYFANLLNPYHYDKKHYNDRPYLMTSPAFENVPIFGDALSSTIGKVVKPQVKMHKDYWNNDGSVKTSEQINGEQLIVNIEQQRLASAGVQNVMMAHAGQTVQSIYENTFTDNIKAYTELAKQKAMELIKDVELGTRKVVNTFHKEEELPQYESNINTERAMLNEMEKYSHSISIRRNKNRVDDSQYYKEVNDQVVEDMLDKGYEVAIDSRKTMNKSKAFRDIDSLYYGSQLAYQPTVEYKPNQLQLPSDVTPSQQEVGGNIYVPSDTTGVTQPGGKGVYGSVYQNQTGVSLGYSKGYSNLIDFDKAYDLSNQNMLYRTGSGKISVINTGQEIDPITSVNLGKESPNSFTGIPKHHTITDDYLINKDDISKVRERDIQYPNSLETTIQKQVADTSNVAGIYGFGFSSLVTGDTQKGTTVIETPGYSRSFNKMFWDKEVGGFGGDISEIFRRLVQKRQENGVEYYNPIRNTMPDWIEFVQYKLS